MHKFVVIKYLLQSMTLEQIYIVQANSESESNQMTSSYGSMSIVLDIDLIDASKEPFKYFKE